MLLVLQQNFDGDQVLMAFRAIGLYDTKDRLRMIAFCSYLQDYRIMILSCGACKFIKLVPLLLVALNFVT